MGLVIRPLAIPAEFEKAEELQMSVWGGGDRRIITSKEAMIAMHHNGGLALGAFTGRKMVGFSLMMVGYLKGTVYLYSHQTGVLQECQSKGVGYLLKRKQREVAIARGFKMIAWTFDPIIARNAYFNLGKLGAVARNYHVDYYGNMRDSINYDWPTDRILAEWYVNPAIKSRIASNAKKGEETYSPLRTAGAEPYPKCLDWTVDLKAQQVLVQIPRDIIELKRHDRAEAIRWREATREVFMAYFGAGYSAVSVSNVGGLVKYVLAKVRLPRNIFMGLDLPSAPVTVPRAGGRAALPAPAFPR